MIAFYKKTILSLSLFCCCTVLLAQELNVDTLILPISKPSPEFREYLVQLAWINNPSNKVYDYNVNIAKEEIDIAKKSIANDIAFSFNLNENNIPGQESTAGVNINTFPRYNFQLTLNLGRIVTLKNEVQKALENLKIEEANLDQRKIEIRAETLRRYEVYLHTIEIIAVRKKAERDFQQTYTLMENRFKDRTADFEEFSRASSAYQSAVESRMVAEGDLLKAQIDLEEMIGLSLELAEGFHKTSSRTIE